MTSGGGGGGFGAYNNQGGNNSGGAGGGGSSGSVAHFIVYSLDTSQPTNITISGHLGEGGCSCEMGGDSNIQFEQMYSSVDIYGGVSGLNGTKSTSYSFGAGGMGGYMLPENSTIPFDSSSNFNLCFIFESGTDGANGQNGSVSPQSRGGNGGSIRFSSLEVFSTLIERIHSLGVSLDYIAPADFDYISFGGTGGSGTVDPSTLNRGTCGNDGMLFYESR